jgi:hypothetical protein
MARIRSIYPSTPTDPEFALNAVEGRLLFIYSWTLADDAGNLERNPLGLKMALFPGDDWASVKRVAELVDALIVGRFYEPYEADGKQYLHVRNFARYQKPDHPTAPRYPLVPGQEYTYHVRLGNGWSTKTEKGALPEPTPNVPRKYKERSRRIGSGLEGKGKEVDWKGEDRKGGDRGGKPTKAKPDARPLAFEGQAASSENKDKDNGNGTGTATASGKGVRGTESTVKIAAMKEVKRLLDDKEIDLAGASDKLRTFGFSHSEINSPAMMQFLQQAAIR